MIPIGQLLTSVACKGLGLQRDLVQKGFRVGHRPLNLGQGLGVFTVQESWLFRVSAIELGVDSGVGSDKIPS